MGLKKVLPLAGVLAALSAPLARAQLSVVATIPDLRALAAEVGGAAVSAESIGKGTQDPHFIEAKPSYMSKISRADLVVAVGLDLEIGWLPSLLQGARNPKVMPGSRGYLELGPTIEALEVPKGKVTRADGDVHPYGNPHFTLDPIRAGKAALALAERLGALDPSHREAYVRNAKALQARLAEKASAWSKRVAASGVKSVVTYHKTLTYFLDRFGVANPEILEPKPGIPPTSGHILDVIRLIRERKVPLVLVENFFDSSVTKRIQEAVPSVRVRTVPVLVEGEPGVTSLDALYEALVKALEAR